MNHLIAKQHDVEIEGARSPAFGFAHAALLELNALGVIQQRFCIKGCFQHHGSVQVIRLILWAERRGTIKRRDGDDPALRNLAQRLYGSVNLLQRRG